MKIRSRAAGLFAWVAVLFVADSSIAVANDLFPDALVHFVPRQGNPVFAGTGKGTWDHAIRERGYVLRHGGKWHGPLESTWAQLESHCEQPISGATPGAILRARTSRS